MEVIMRSVAFCILSITLSFSLISACSGPTRLEKNFGKSVEQARLNQTLNPEAQKNLEPVTGLDGKAAQKSIERYQKSFEQARDGSQPYAQTQTGTQVVDKPIEGGGYGK